jgi:hypothetical protein
MGIPVLTDLIEENYFTFYLYNMYLKCILITESNCRCVYRFLELFS